MHQTYSPSSQGGLDAHWQAVADFILPRLAAGDSLVAPHELAACFPNHECLSYEDDFSGKREWVVLHKGMLREAHACGLISFCFVLDPVFSNDVFVVFASRNRFEALPESDPHYQSFIAFLDEEVTRALPASPQAQAPSAAVAAASHPAIYLGGHLALTRTMHGQKIYVDTRDKSVAPHLLMDGKWEDWVTPVFAAQVKEGDTVIEVGANTGYYTLLAASKVGPRGKVIAFEANKDLCDLLFRSIEVNGFIDRCEVVNKAVTDKTGMVSFHKHKELWASSSIFSSSQEILSKHHDSTEDVSIESASLGDFLRERALRHVDFIKIDAEGCEPLIFKGLDGLLESDDCPAVIFEFGPNMIRASGCDPLEFLQTLLNKGFLLQIITPGGLRPVEPLEKTLGIPSCDILMRKVKKERAVTLVPAITGSKLPDAPAEADFQKISDAADFHHPLMLRTARETLGISGFLYNQRLWEFTIVYAALESLGFLEKEKTGISFGAGVEVLLYAISNKVKMIYATDLYTADSTWTEANTSDPRKFVIDSAPIPCTPEAMTVMNMDMRKVTLPDASVDFCYSISVMEHIGDDLDFVAHLREARRILKDDGVYLLTTTFIPTGNTIKQPGTWMFSPVHLHELFEKAGLRPCECLNATISDCVENTPALIMGTLSFPSPLDAGIPHIFTDYVSAPMGACCFLLRKHRSHEDGMKIAGLEETAQKLGRLRSNYQRELWSAPVSVNVARHGHFFAQNPEYFCYTESFEFEGAEMQATFHFTCGQEEKSDILIFVQHCPFDEPLNIAHSHHRHVRIQGKPGQVCTHTFTIKTQARRGYTFIARVENGGAKPAETQLWLQRNPAPETAAD